jgi:hypothetical protein
MMVYAQLPQKKEKLGIKIEKKEMVFDQNT